MRVDVKKILFIGLNNDRDAFFKEAQKKGFVEFIDGGLKPALEAPLSIQRLSSALKIIRSLPIVEQEEVEDLSIAEEIARQILDEKQKEEALLEEQRVLGQEKARIQVFGDFNLDDLAYIQKEGHRIVQFFCAKKGTAEKLEGIDGLFYVGTDHGLDYFISIQKEAVSYEGMIEMHIQQTLSSVEKRQLQIEREISTHEHELHLYAKYDQLIRQALAAKLDVYHLDKAEGFIQPVVDDNLYAVEGWVPVDHINELKELTQAYHLHIEEVAINEDDKIPTYLKNKGVARLGEDLIGVYDTPSHTDRDPSLWVFGFFALFFAMIVGDGGYGFIFLAIATYLSFKHAATSNALNKRMIRLVQLLGIACIAWGLLTNSFFASSLGIDHPLRKISLLNWLAEKKAAYHMNVKDDVYEYWIKEYPETKEATTPKQVLRLATVKQGEGVKYGLLDKFYDNFFMEFALLFGCVHLIISMMRYADRNLINVGWIIFLIGGYLYFPEYLNATTFVNYLLGVSKATAAEVGLPMMYIGIGFALFVAVIKHKLLGLLEGMTLIQVFADVLSYLRLYALGMSGAIVATVVNDAAASMNFLFAGVLLILGHIVNITLAVMSGVIHGLRLNFIEWYHYCFEGGGKHFDPLKKNEID